MPFGIFFWAGMPLVAAVLADKARSGKPFLRGGPVFSARIGNYEASEVQHVEQIRRISEELEIDALPYWRLVELNKARLILLHPRRMGHPGMTGYSTRGDVLVMVVPSPDGWSVDQVCGYQNCASSMEQRRVASEVVSQLDRMLDVRGGTPVATLSDGSIVYALTTQYDWKMESERMQHDIDSWMKHQHDLYDAYRLEDADGGQVTFAVRKDTGSVDQAVGKGNVETSEMQQALIQEFKASRYGR